MSWLEAGVLGMVQGLAEWLPISSEGMIVLVRSWWFGGGLGESITIALWLHLGTFLAALVYFRVEVLQLLRVPFQYKKASAEEVKTFWFLVVATLVTGVLGAPLLYVLTKISADATVLGRGATLLTGVALLITAWLLGRKGKVSTSTKSQPSLRDALILGLGQGLTIIPGLSRSGTTTALLLLRGLNSATALKLSFLMSLPVVLGANIILQAKASVTFSLQALFALLVAAVVGYVTIHSFLAFARRVRFESFVLLLALLVLLAALIG